MTFTLNPETGEEIERGGGGGEEGRGGVILYHSLYGPREEDRETLVFKTNPTVRAILQATIESGCRASFGLCVYVHLRTHVV